MKRICIESPLSGDFVKNIEYARRCMRFVLDLEYAPFVSHLLYTQVLDDRIPAHRGLGIEAGLAMGDSCDARWFFLNGGPMSRGMLAAWDRADSMGQAVRKLDGPSTTGEVEFHEPAPTPGLRQLNESQHQRLWELCGNLKSKAFSNAYAFDGHWRALDRVLRGLDGVEPE